MSRYSLQKWALTHHPSQRPALDAPKLSSKAFATPAHRTAGEPRAPHLEMFIARQHPHSATAHCAYHIQGENSPVKHQHHQTRGFFGVSARYPRNEQAVVFGKTAGHICSRGHRALQSKDPLPRPSQQHSWGNADVIEQHCSK